MDASALGAIALEVERILHGVASALEDRLPLDGTCRDLRQVRAVLELTDVGVLARVVQEIESLVRARLQDSSPIADHARGVCYSALTAVCQGMSALAGGFPCESLGPVLQQLLDAGGPDRVAVARVSFNPDLSRLPPARDVALSADAAPADLRGARARFQKALLAWIRDADADALVSLREIVDQVEASVSDQRARAPWWIASGFLELLAAGAVEPVAQARRICAALDLHLRNTAEGTMDAPEALMREMLYFIAASSSTGERVTAVRRTYLVNARPRATPAQAGVAPLTSDPWGALKDSLEKAAGATAQQWHEFRDALTQAAASIPAEAGVARLLAQMRAVAECDEPSYETRELLSAELATALLFVEDARTSQAAGVPVPDHIQVDAMVHRLRAASAGQVDHAARRVNLQSRAAQQAMQQAATHCAVAEVLAAVTGAVQGLESYFADRNAHSGLDAADRALLMAQKVLQLMTESQASAAAGYCRDQIARLRSDPGAGSESDLAQTASVLCALSYYLEQSRFGQADFAAIMGRAGAPDHIGNQTLLTPPYPDAQCEIVDITGAMSLELLPPTQPDTTHPAVEPSAALPQPAPESVGSEHWDQVTDAGLLPIFIDEAIEVLGAVRDALARLSEAPGDAAALATTRRAFHTLKGSGRMVGLVALAQAAAEVEQVMNGVMDCGHPASTDLLRLVHLACERCGTWIAQLAREGRARVDAEELRLWIAQFKRGEPFGDSMPAAQPAPETEPAAEPHDDEAVPAADLTANPVAMAAPIDRSVEIGAVRISRALYASFMQEARQLVSGLRKELGAITARVEHRAADHDLLRFAHTLSGIAGTVRIGAIQQLAGALEDVAELLHREALNLSPADESLFNKALTAVETMIEDVAACTQPQARADLQSELQLLAYRLAAQLDALAPAQEHSRDIAVSFSNGPAFAPQALSREAAQASGMGHGADRRRARLEDDIDVNLLPVFLEEAADLAPRIGQELRDWRAHPAERQLPLSVARLLHTFKGSARMAGAMGLGELTHSMEARVSVAAQLGTIPESVFDGLEHSFDRIGVLLERLTRTQLANSADNCSAAGTPPDDRSFSGGLSAMPAPADRSQALPDAMPAQWSSHLHADLTGGAILPANATRTPLLLRVRAERVEQLVAGAGEVAIARARLAGEVRAMRSTGRDIATNLARLKTLSRELEIQAQSQMQSQMVQHMGPGDSLDPLEFDRFTRLQELTRFIAESAGDVATLQHNISRNLDTCESALDSQARMTRALQDGLMSVRMLAFASLNERLFRVVRLTARESAKRVKLDIRGDKVELDRGVIERIIGPLEHLLRNAVVHGIESTPQRLAAGKPAAGELTLDIRQEGNEVSLTLRDDGRGLDIGALRAKAIAAGLIKADLLLADSQIVQFAFASGVSTAENVTESAGRGVGLDVVRSEVAALGGRVDVSFEPDKGTTFSIHLPLMVAVMHVLVVRCGGQQFALPTMMVSQVRAVAAPSLARLYEVGRVDWRGEAFPMHDLRALLGMGEQTERPPQRHTPIILIRGGTQRIAVEVDEIVGHEEVVVKNIGTQVARVTGITGAAVRGGGAIVLILDPVQLARRAPANRSVAASVGKSKSDAASEAAASVLVVDDSATVRKVTNRILTRQGYNVIEARDGLEALEKMRIALPSVMLLDVEMPRMDGFEVLRRLRDEAAWQDIPVIVITSRTAEKHRRMAMDLGASVFLGKPFEEQDLLAQVARVTVKESD